MSRNQIISLGLVLFFILILVFRFDRKENYISNSGFIQGTTYNIKYKHTNDLQVEIDSILHLFDMSLSTYVPNSIISRVNQNDSLVKLNNDFKRFFEVAMEVSEQTKGAFDITMAPIVNAWGFGFSKMQNVDSLLIDSLLQLTGYENVAIIDDKIIKQKEGLMLDGNAIAQGQSVDVISLFLEDKEISDYLVDIGGEIRTKGKNPKNENWRIGIDKPIENSTEYDRELQAIINISDKSLATSGNYRKFYEKDGIKYSHTINPETGYPVNHNLLSATVITNECIYADAYATAFMVMGVQNAIAFLNNNKNIDAYLIYSDSLGNYDFYLTPGIKEYLEEAN